MLQLKQYKSPESETSLYKGIPIQYLPEVKSLFNSLGISVRYLFRGPRGKENRPSCRFADARTFAVYQRSEVQGLDYVKLADGRFKTFTSKKYLTV